MRPSFASRLQWMACRFLWGLSDTFLGYGNLTITGPLWPKGYSRESPQWPISDWAEDKRTRAKAAHRAWKRGA